MSARLWRPSSRFIALTVRVRDVVFCPEKLRVNVEPVFLVLDGKLAGFLDWVPALKTNVLAQLHQQAEEQALLKAIARCTERHPKLIDLLTIRISIHAI